MSAAKQHGPIITFPDAITSLEAIGDRLLISTESGLYEMRERKTHRRPHRPYRIRIIEGKLGKA